jgi:hypothetical protein
MIGERLPPNRRPKLYDDGRLWDWLTDWIIYKKHMAFRKGVKIGIHISE